MATACRGTSGVAAEAKVDGDDVVQPDAGPTPDLVPQRNEEHPVLGEERRNPADDDAHYVLGAALQASGAAEEGAREKDLARRLSSVYSELDASRTGNSVPRIGMGCPGA